MAAWFCGQVLDTMSVGRSSIRYRD